MKTNEMPWENPERRTVVGVLSDPSSSYWLRTALETALPRDPVDAANDAEVLYDLLRGEADALAARLLAQADSPCPRGWERVEGDGR